MNSATETEERYPAFDHTKLLELAATKMPFGKYQADNSGDNNSGLTITNKWIG